MNAEQLDRLARRRAGAKLGWYVHAMVYLAVNAGLAAISVSVGRSWAVYPALGWGIGLLVHGGVVLLMSSSLRERMVERERAALQASSGRTTVDPW